MAKPIERIIEIPSGVEVSLNKRSAVVKGNGKENRKELPFLKDVLVQISDEKITIFCKKPTKREGAVAGSIEAHFNNLIKGILEDYVYKLEICNVHFPMNVKKDGNKLIIKNFLGEKKDRVAKILDGVQCEIKGNIVELKSSNKEAVGQTAANIEQITKVSNRDRRVFQDGIYIIEKGGREL